MSDKAKRNNLEFRPHFKTHQSHKIGNIFRDFGVTGITVSSLKMARYFADAGWNDITVAFPINVLAADDYNELASKINLKTLAISKEAVEKLDAGISEKMGLYIEIDPEYGRSGIPASDLDKISEVKKAIEDSAHFNFEGFYCHAGHTYQARSKDEVRKVAEAALEKLAEIKSEFKDTAICYGDTPSCSVLDEFGPATQISPGNFVFYDWMQFQIGSCSPDEIAIYMEVPVVEKFDQRKQILIHGGAVHFSKEEILVDGKPTFGQLITPELSAENRISKVSQEHGIIECATDVYEQYKIGESIKIYPIHSCLTSNLMKGYRSTTGEEIDHLEGNH